MKIAIIDDEEDARFLLRNALEKAYPEQIDLIIEVSNVKDGILLVQRELLDIIFLDIQLQDGTGFDLLEKAGDIAAKIVFVTAYDDYALRAFDFYAFAYLVKPFKHSALVEVVDRILADQEPVEADHMAMISQMYQDPQHNQIIIPELDGFQVVQKDEVLYIQSDNNYSEFILVNGKRITSSKTLKDYERLLDQSGFLRIHRSYLINLQQVRGYSNVDGNFVKIGQGHEVPIGRRKLAQFRKLFLG